MKVFTWLGRAVGFILGSLLIVIASIFATGPLALALASATGSGSSVATSGLPDILRFIGFLLPMTAVIALFALGVRGRRETLRRLEWWLAVVGGALTLLAMGKLLFTPTGISETSSIDSHGHARTITHASYLLPGGAAGVMAGVAFGAIVLAVVGGVLYLAYRGSRFESGNLALLWTVAVLMEVAAIVTGFGVGFWFLLAPPFFLTSALAGSLAGLGGELRSADSPAPAVT